MPKSKVVPQFKVGDVINLRRIPGEVNYLSRWTKYTVVELTTRSYVLSLDGNYSSWSKKEKVPLTLKGWQIGSDEDVALTEFVLSEKYRIAQVLQTSWNERIIYQVALALEHESAYLRGQLAIFRGGKNEQTQSIK